MAQERRQGGNGIVEHARDEADFVALAPRRFRVQCDAPVLQLVQVQTARPTPAARLTPC